MDRLRARIAWWLDEPLDRSARDRLAVLAAVAAFLAGAYSFVFASAEVGVVLAVEGDRIVVADVAPWSPARAYGLQAGMVVVDLNGELLVALPGHEGEPVASTDALGALARTKTWSLGVMQPWELERALAGGPYGSVSVGYDENILDSSGPALLVGLGIFLVGAWWLLTGRGWETLRSLAIPIVVATAAPLFLLPALLTWSLPGIVIVALLTPLAILPLADGLSSLVEAPYLRRRVRLAAVACAAGAAAAGALVLTAGLGGPPTGAQWILAGAIPFVPGIVASRPAVVGAPRGGSPSGRLVESLEVAAVAATPAVALTALLVPSYQPILMPILLWIAALLAANRFTVRPLVRLVTRAQLQRDLVVAATEAERARIAANLHDDALQDLTMIVRRLDARGDAENADAARQVAERLRAICGDLRLPILDDLGVGPALAWLVTRIERLAGGEVRLERDDGTRPPPDVELAFFRVAQEALANAVKHGRPPIVVRYRVSPSGASLSIDDAGPGITSDAAETAPRNGHFGLLNMQQRAEQIGAILDVRRWPGGGTHVALEWRPR